MKAPIYPYALFDMDGTLVDSMAYWKQVPEDYIASYGKTLDEAGMQRIVRSRGYGEILAYLSEIGVPCDMPTLIAFAKRQMAVYYETAVKAKPGTVPLLETLKAAGCRMGIISMTPHEDVDICLARTGLAPYFEFVLTPEDTPDRSGKEQNRIFEIALSRWGGVRPEECLFFEDALYAIETAYKMGFHIRGVEDQWADFERDRIVPYCEEYLNLD